jgi:nucleoside-diphosphate-sugar epimerase
VASGPNPDKPAVLLTGAAGNLGRSIAAALAPDYLPIGIDRSGEADFPVIAADLTEADEIARALDDVRARVGDRLASVIHLAAFFDFSGEEHPLYERLNVEGSRLLVRGLRARFEVEQLLYASTMLVHAPVEPGERIDEDSPIGPRWAYPRSKAAAEAAIEAEAGDMKLLILRLAGVYDEEEMVPTLAHQIARIREKDVQSRFYSGDLEVGQAMLHRADMLDAFRRAVDRRAALPRRAAVLIGEPDAPGYGALQDRIGCLLHGEEEWTTLRLPKPVAAAGAWAMEKLEPVIPNSIDKGAPPFVKPFMVRMADDHYALDVSRAERLLGWTPRHRLMERLPDMVEALRRDPAGWYARNGVPPPPEEAQSR